jgi:hypothetical protein
VLLLDEVSLIGSHMLYNIDKRMREIKHAPTNPFGNVDVIFYGDLFQAEPVHDSWIFEFPTFRQDKFPYSFWLDNIKYYELTKVVRQENDIFISILNRIRKGLQSASDIQYLNAHCHRPAPVDPTFPFLYYRNKDVDSHNAKMLSYVETEAFTFIAHDNKIDEADSNYERQKTNRLPQSIVLKKNMLVELIGGNYLIEDGLVNGTEAIFRHYDKTYS